MIMSMVHRFLFVLLAQGALSFVLPNQHAFSIPSIEDESNVIHELHRAEIIPTVLDDFNPAISLSVKWKKADAKLGNMISPSKLQDAPDIKLKMLSNKDRAEASKDMQLTVALTDPDAPSRDDPEWSQICHWIMTGFSIRASTVPEYDLDGVFSILPTHSFHGTKNEREEVMPYKPPGPPPKTGKHRYVFVVLAPSNGTKEALYLSKPGDRQHWGYKKERAGLREWAEENWLSVVGANFIYAQNNEQ